MKPSRHPSYSFHPSIAALVVVACTPWASPSAQAAAFIWDGNTGIPGAQDDSGTWNVGNTNWISGGSNVVWANTNDATFGGGTDGAYAVTVALNPTANSLIFNNSGYTLSAAGAQTITVSSTTAALVVAAGKSATIGGNVTVTTPTLNQNSVMSGTGTLTIESGGTLKGSGTVNTNILSINGTTVEVKTGGTVSTLPLASNGTALFLNGTMNVTGGTVTVPGTLGLGQSTGTTAGTLNISSGIVTANSTNGLRIGGTSGTTAGGTVNLDGGTLAASTIFKGAGGTVTTSLLNLNGGTLQATAASTTFISALARANVRNGGALINSNGFNLTVPQALLHSNVGGDAVTDGGLVKSGLGTLTLTGANTYNGGTTINGGTLQFGAGALPASGTITINSGGALSAAGAFANVAAVLGAGSVSTGSSGAVALTGASSENISLGSYSNLMLGASAASSYTGTLSPSGATYRLGGGGATLTLPGANALTGANNLVIGATGSTGTVVLANSNDYSGSTTVNSGTLQLGDGVADGSLTNTTGIVNNGALVFNAVGSQSVSQSISGTGSLTKQGAGTLTLGGANSYSGPTTVSTGILLVTSSTGLGSSVVTVPTGNNQLQFSGNITLTNPIRGNSSGLGSTDGVIKNISGNNTLTDFGFAGTSGTRINLVGGSTLSLPNDFAAGNLSSFRVIGTGTLDLGGNNTGAIGAAQSFILGDGTNPGPTIKVGNNAALGAGVVNFQPGSAATLQSSNGAARVLGNALTFNGTAASLGAASTGDLTLSGAVTLAANLSLTVGNTSTILSGVVGETGGARSLTKSGDGNLTLSGANTYNGGTTVNQGTATAGHASAFGSGTVTVASGATLDLGGFAVANTVVNQGGTISGASSYAGSQSVTGASSFSGTVGGGVTVSSGGTLGGTATFTGAVTIAAGGVHAPGNSPGIETFSAGITYETGSTLSWEFVGDTLAIRGTDYDGVDVTGGDLTIEAGATLALLASAVDYAAAPWDSVRVFTVADHSGAGSSSGLFTLDTSAAGSFVTEGSWGLSALSGDVLLTWTPVPEPSTWAALAGLAVLGAAAIRRRRS